MLGAGGPVGLPRNVEGPADAPPGHAPTSQDLANEALLHDAGVDPETVLRRRIWTWSVLLAVIGIGVFLLLNR